MDDLYINLEDYNDVNVVDELKCENKELKLKLEEITKAMAILQKDFDKLSSEYKKLEVNYSSLLKTARAEIDRKTEAIKILNQQKDMIIINTLKETGKNVSNIRKRNFIARPDRNIKPPGEVVDKEKQNSKIVADNDDKKDNRVESSCTASIDNVSTTSTGNKSTSSEEKVPKPVEFSENNKNKENVSKASSKDDALQNRNVIMNRRKSLSRISHHEPKFSSDEDAEAKLAARRLSPFRRDVRHWDSHDTRVDCRIENYDNYYDSVKEHFGARTSRYTNYDKYSNVDRNESYQKHRRQYSPERDHHRYTDEYTEDYHSRGDFGRQRVSRTNSRLSDNYNRSKSRDRRFNYDRDNYREYDNQSNRYYKNTAVKHKLRNEFDEPSSKRQRIDVLSKAEVEANTQANNKERKISDRIHVMTPQEYKENSSCQSPDYVNVDSCGSQHFIKEIMNTAETHLEDPRISSKKYVLKTLNESTVLSTVSGRDIDMHYIDKSLWGQKAVDVPPALTKPISNHDNENILKELYTDIDGLSVTDTLHNSLESDEIDKSKDDQPTIDFEEIDKNNDNKTDRNIKVDEYEGSKLNKSDDKLSTIKEPEKSLPTKFKIPKIKKPDKTDLEKDLTHRETDDMSKKSVPNIDISFERQQNIEDVSDKQNSKKNKIRNYSQDNSDSIKTIIDKRTQDIIRTIEGDLELSDETSDITDFLNDTNNKCIENAHESNIKISIDKDLNTIIKENKPDTSSFKSEPSSKSISSSTSPPPSSSSRKDKVKSSSKKCLTKDSTKESSKRRKSKKKSIEEKEIDSISSEKQHEKSRNTKKSKEKESKHTVSKETISKFSDLFGDSSSLITPDDLGINNATAIQVQPTDKYTSIFDNTQDAVDLSVLDITNTLTSTDKVNVFDTVIQNPHDDKVADTITNHFSVNVTVVNENSDSKEDQNSPLNNVYENTKSDILTDTNNVVKTVIISSGIQPECSPDSCTLVDTPNIIAPLQTAPTNEVSLKKCPLNSIKALATSTPQKYIEQVDVSASLRDSVCTEAPTDIINTLPNVSDCSNPNNNDDPQKEADIPDVRIFVRRRRKPVRKAT